MQQDIKLNLLDTKFDRVDPELRKLLKSMLTFNPQERLSAAQCLKNPIFDDIR